MKGEAFMNIALELNMRLQAMLAAKCYDTTVRFADGSRATLRWNICSDPKSWSYCEAIVKHKGKGGN